MYRVIGVLWVAAIMAILFCPIPVTEESESQPIVEVAPPVPVKPVVPVEPEEAPTTQTEKPLVREDIPLDAETQQLLYQASIETGIPYELALAVIQQETDFKNIVGDGGDSVGYMQVQPRWHSSRMKRLGVSDLTDPYGNFLVGCDYLAEMIGKNRGLEWALHAYNGGPTYANNMAKAEKTSQYVKNVLNYMNILKTEEF